MARLERDYADEARVMAKLRDRGGLSPGVHVTHTIYCLLPNQRVSAAGITGATMRRYEGEIVVLNTASGNQLAVTPNHPILTRRGWLAAKAINERDEVAEGSVSEWGGHDTHNVQVPTRVADVFSSLRQSNLLLQRSGMREDFHGDGTDSVIDIVLQDSLLLNTLHPTSAETLDEFVLPSKDGSTARLSSLSTLVRPGRITRPTCPRKPRYASVLSDLLSSRRGDNLPLGQRRTSVAVARRFGIAAQREAARLKEVGEVRSSETDFLGKRWDGFPGQISFVQLANVERQFFAGHVYNLQTESGTYVAEHIITHNCNVKAWASLRWHDEQPEHDDATILRFSIGHAVAGDIEMGEMSQVTVLAPDTEDVGSIDMMLQGHAVEIKVTSASMLKPVDEQARGAWMEQVGEYAWRASRRGTKEVWARVRAVHLMGDWGKKFCPKPGHGIPQYEEGETPFRRKNPETKRPNLACPIKGCWDLLVEGERGPTLRCWKVYWTWEELDSLHRIHAERGRQLQADVENAEFKKGSPPPWKWGYPEFECMGCAVKEAIGCAGMEEAANLADELEGSILEMQEVKA